jgi:peptide/nickel transport system permease protein
MARFIIKRLLLGVLTLFATSVITFAMLFALPHDPIQVVCGKICPPDRAAAMSQMYGLDKPIVVQYGEYMKGIFVGRDLGSSQGGHCSAPCLGWSILFNEHVTTTIARVMPVTFSIVLPAATLWLLLGVGLGMISALRRNTWIDRAAIGFSLVGASVQLYFVGLVLLSLFVYQTNILPFPTYTSIFDNPWKWATGLVLPWITLAFLFSAIYARLSRAQMIETLSEDYIRTARAKGLSKTTIYFRHALRAAIAPIVTIFGLDLGATLGGTIITEWTFGLNGLGKTAVYAVHQADYNTTMAIVLISAVFIVVANLLVDVIYSLIDPRVRLG